MNAGYGLAYITIDDHNCEVSCSSQHLTPNGFTIGGTLGFNWQFGSTVLGIEGDWNWIHAEKTISTNDWPSRHHAELDSFATVRVRAGLAFDRTLVYVTAGVGWLDREASAICHSCSRPGFTFSDTDAGLALGAGIEFALWDRWTAKLEYLFVGVPTVYQIPNERQDNDYENFNVASQLHVVRIGLNYRFDWGKGPVLARY